MLYWNPNLLFSLGTQKHFVPKYDNLIVFKPENFSYTLRTLLWAVFHVLLLIERYCMCTLTVRINLSNYDKTSVFVYIWLCAAWILKKCILPWEVSFFLSSSMLPTRILFCRSVIRLSLPLILYIYINAIPAGRKSCFILSLSENHENINLPLTLGSWRKSSIVISKRPANAFLGNIINISFNLERNGSNLGPLYFT